MRLRYEYKGKTYLYLGLATHKSENGDTTNVLYRPEDSTDLFTREKDEFFAKFVKIRG